MNNQKLNSVAIILLGIALLITIVIAKSNEKKCNDRYNDLEKKLQAWKQFMFRTLRILLIALLSQNTDESITWEVIDLRSKMKRINKICDQFRNPLLYHGECYYAAGVDSLISDIKDLTDGVKCSSKQNTAKNLINITLDANGVAQRFTIKTW